MKITSNLYENNRPVVSEYSYIAITSGSSVGTTFLLDPTDHNRLGRGLNCDIVLADPLCSRVHAELIQEQQGWRLLDKNSRNGTYVDDKRVESILLTSGARIRLGSTEMMFNCSSQPPTRNIEQPVKTEEQVVKQTEMHTFTDERMLSDELEKLESHADLLAAYQLSLQLIGCDDPNVVIQRTLELLHRRLHASLVGFLWLHDDGQLRVKKVIPHDVANEFSLSESLTANVVRRGVAVWIAYQDTEHASDSLQPFSDAICVPVLCEQQTIGVIHAYQQKDRFGQSDYSFALAMTNLLAVALNRSRRSASLEADHRRLVASSGAVDDLIGQSEPMKQLKEKIAKVARAAGSVLIRGESGCGKELVARAIHRCSARADRPLLSVNCAAIPHELMESQLFGHQKGAFTGAQQDHAGMFEQADTGTLFLDEIGELTLAGQAKLLRILEGHSFLPVGGTEELTVDVRVLAATNRELKQLVTEKKFREDLFYRLSVFELFVPPLRDRHGDVEILLQYFLEHFRTQHGRPNLRLSDNARRKLLAYAWPGNVRQLKNVIDSATVLCSKDEIHVEDLGLHDAGTDHLASLRIVDWEKKLIREALGRSARNVPAAAKLLGISRATLYRKIDEYKIPK